MKAEWKFRKMAKAETNVDPIADEFFSTEALDSLSDALVREFIQNSLDAGVGRPIRVRFSLTGVERPLSKKDASPYLNKLGPNLAIHFSDPTEKIWEQPMTYLVIEDFETRGLTGDYRQVTDTSLDEEKNNFYYFFRNIGRSKKGDKDRGRWGLGKTVLPASSKIHSFIALTIRLDDDRALLMGQSILKIHAEGDRRFDPYGYYGFFDNEQFQLPITDWDTIQLFANTFGLRRGDEPGLSVVIPYPRDQIKMKDLVSSAIHHYFFPILKGELDIEVSDANKQVALTSSTLEIASNHFFAGVELHNLINLFGFTKNVLSLIDTDFVHLKNCGKDYKWSESLFQETNIADLRAKFELGELVAVQVPMNVFFKKGGGSETFFRAYIKKEDDLTQGEIYFIREGLTIPQVGKPPIKGFRGMVIIDDSHLSRFLGDAENPAHTDWFPRSGRISENKEYLYADGAIRFVKQSLQKLISLLSKPPEGRDKKILMNVFYETQPPDPSSPTQKGSGKKPGQGPSKPVPIEPKKKSRPYKIVRRSGGFRVLQNLGAPFRQFDLRIRVAYDTAKGNAFSNYEEMDFAFDVSPISISSSGVTLHSNKRNVLEISVNASPFEISVMGFDPNRDIVVEARITRVADDVLGAITDESVAIDGDDFVEGDEIEEVV